MTIDDIQCIGVVGTGQMGCGIANVVAMSGWDVLLLDVSSAIVKVALERIKADLERAVTKGILHPGHVAPCVARLHPIGRIEELAEAQFVIEATPEDSELKTDLFRQMGVCCKPETILASNTSSISITLLGKAAERPDCVVGIHFMNPAPVMRLVEIVRGLETSQETVARATGLVMRMGKTPVICIDTPGFIVNRLLIPMINEAICLLQERQGESDSERTPEAIDLAMTAGANHPQGPLALADRIGLDTVLAICEVLHHDLGDSKFSPNPLLRKYVEAGWLGRKSGRGFYV
ncbi:MAG: 3-hydroxyacyl-CoA dehydrogenase NAD-binding domain-containing protein, partial [Candidatus Thalassarchaeaceae archaeon]|nr:3-hydroxyacyl-CoA dehydrogenase NAD-binding domain-containing protein [Candidatus Thalassarchaeaceae archaeon]